MNSGKSILSIKPDKKLVLTICNLCDVFLSQVKNISH